MTVSHTSSTSRALRLAAGLTGTAVLAMALVGCGTGGGSSDGTVEITLSMQNPDVQSADPATWAIVEAFEDANPDVKVEVSGEAVAEHLQKITIAAQSDTLPDIFWVYKSTAVELDAAGKLLDLRPMLDEAGITERFPESTVSNFSSGDAIFGVPYQGLLTGLWYNEQILADHGLEVPTTFDDLMAVTETLSEAGVTTISNGANQSSFSVWSWLVDLERFGFSDKIEGILDGSESYVNDDFLRLYEHIAELRDAGAFPSNVSTQTYQQAVDQFTSGKAAFLDAGVWASSAIQDAGIQAGFWKGPEFDDGVGEQNIIMNVASAPLTVAAKVGDDEAKLDAVTRFIEFYYGDEAQQLLVDNGQPPVTDYVADLDPETQSALKAALDATTADGVSSPETQPDLVVSTAVASAMYDSIYGVIQDQLEPEAALELVQAAIDAE
jgi:raffinose/stachyose/melibiose transport system substrate-binding protein